MDKNTGKSLASHQLTTVLPRLNSIHRQYQATSIHRITQNVSGWKGPLGVI